MEENLLETEEALLESVFERQGSSGSRLGCTTDSGENTRTYTDADDNSSSLRRKCFGRCGTSFIGIQERLDGRGFRCRCYSRRPYIKSECGWEIDIIQVYENGDSGRCSSRCGQGDCGSSSCTGCSFCRRRCSSRCG